MKIVAAAFALMISSNAFAQNSPVGGQTRFENWSGLQKMIAKKIAAMNTDQKLASAKVEIDISALRRIQITTHIFTSFVNSLGIPSEKVVFMTHKSALRRNMDVIRISYNASKARN